MGGQGASPLSAQEAPGNAPITVAQRPPFGLTASLVALRRGCVKSPRVRAGAGVRMCVHTRILTNRLFINCSL